jgi:broad specificity phosphatase PhoE
MTLKRIVFIRPGETDWNLIGRFQGWLAIPLNELGQQQAQRLGSFVRNLGLSKLYSSDLRRAKDTAEILCAALNFDPIYDDRLREQHVGIWQGLTIPEMHGWYADEYAKMQADIDGYCIKNGESRNDVRKRALAAVTEFIKKADADGDEMIGVLSHTTTIRLLLRELVPDANLTQSHFGNTSVTTLKRQEDGTWELVATNDIMHLEGLESRYMPNDMRGELE